MSKLVRSIATCHVAIMGALGKERLDFNPNFSIGHLGDLGQIV